MPPDSDAPSPETKAPASMADGAPWVTALLVVVALGAGYLGAWFALDSITADLQTRPPVLVLDMAAVLQGLSPEDAGREIARQQAIATRLADRGVLVLDAQAIIAAPRDFYLTRDLDAR